MQDVMNVNQKEDKIVKLLGHGNGGYSYLAIKSKQNKMIIIDCCKQELEFQECQTLIQQMKEYNDEKLGEPEDTF